MEQYKTCTKCGQTKKHLDFYKRTASKDGLSYCCILCDKLYKKTKPLSSKETDRKRAATWNKSNPDRRSEIVRKSDQKRKKETLARSREHYRQNREKLLAQGKRIREMKSPAERRLITLKARAKRRGCPVFDVTVKELSRLIKSSCMYCGLLGPSEIDHLVPLNKNGSHSIGNLVPACRSCNGSKADLFYFEWKIKR